MTRSLPRSAYRALAVMLLAGNAFAYGSLVSERPLAISVLPAGKGHAVLVRSPAGRTLVINAGSDASILRALGTELPPWERSLDALVLTSVRPATSGGASLLLRRYRTDLLVRPRARGTRAQEAALAEARAVREHLGAAGTRLDLGGGTYADIVWPPETPAPLSAKEGGLAVRISYGATAILIYDDLPGRIADRLARADLIISSSTPPASFASDGKTIKETPSR